MTEIILPVHNGLSLLRDGLDAVLAHTSRRASRLSIVDDASDPVTAAWLRERAAAEPQWITLRRQDENLGFLATCNQAMAQGDSAYVVLLNSDVLVSPGWLERLLACAEGDLRLAAVNPLSNRADNIDLPMAPGASYLAVSYTHLDVYKRQILNAEKMEWHYAFNNLDVGMAALKDYEQLFTDLGKLRTEIHHLNVKATEHEKKINQLELNAELNNTNNDSLIKKYVSDVNTMIRLFESLHHDTQLAFDSMTWKLGYLIAEAGRKIGVLQRSPMVQDHILSLIHI